VKVLVVKSNYGKIGGPETLLASIQNRMDRDEFECTLLALSHDAQKPLPFLDAQSFEKQPEKFQLILWKGLTSLPRGILQLLKLIKNTKPDVIYTHDMRANMVAFLASFFTPILWVAHVHGWLGKTAILKTRIFEWIDQRLVRRAQRVLVGSEYLKKQMRELHGISRVEVVPNFLDWEAFQKTPPLDIHRKPLFPDFDGLVIGTASRLHPGKGIHVLIQAFARLVKIIPDVRCLIVGEGPEKARLQQLARDLGIEDRVVFTGYVEEVLPYLRSVQIYVLASLQESLPVSLLEALALGKPAIGTDVGDVGRVLDFGKEHLLVPPGDVDRLYHALVHLCQNPLLQKSLGEKGSEAVKQNYSLSVAIDKIQSVIREVGNQKK